jgi:hypothetical protein
MKHFFWEIFIAGLFSYIGSFLSAACLNKVEMLGLELELAGCKTSVIMPIVFVVPFASLVGILYARRLTQDLHRLGWLGIVSGIILGMLTGYAGIWCIDILGGTFLYALPGLGALAVVIGTRAQGCMH